MINLIEKKYTVDDFIALFGDTYPLLSQLKHTKQDPDWHAEGDVHIHTDMVLKEIYEIIETNEIEQRNHNILILSALFHDYAKPITTKEMDIKGVKRIGAPHHEEVGASLLITLPAPLGLQQNEWLKVIHLTQYHQIPKKLVVKNIDEKGYYLLFNSVGNLDLLYFLELADMKGRECGDKEEQITILEVFKLNAIEFNCFDSNPFSLFLSQCNEQFDSELSERVFWKAISNYLDGTIYMLEEEFPRSYQYRTTQSHVIIACGISGAGKSTQLRTKYPNYEIISLDDYRESISGNPFDPKLNQEAFRQAKEKLKELLRENKDIIWDATNVRKDFREKIVSSSVAYGAFTEIAFFMTSEKQAKKNNSTRKNQVLDSVIEKQCNKLQIPTSDEAHKLTVYF